MGESAIIPEGHTVCMGQRTMLFRVFSDLLDINFLALALLDPLFLSRMEVGAIGSTVKHLRVGDVESLIVPIPPVTEQKAIVTVAHRFLALCDKLEAKLKQSQTDSGKLMDAMVQNMPAA